MRQHWQSRRLIRPEMTSGRGPPPNNWVNALSQVDVYLDNFISTCQGDPKERCQMLHHIFRIIKTVFRPNEATDRFRKEPISTEKLGKEDVDWSTKKIFMRWEIDTK